MSTMRESRPLPLSMLRPMEVLAESRLLPIDAAAAEGGGGSPRDGGCECAGDAWADFVEEPGAVWPVL